MGKNPCKIRRRIMSESHFDQYEHYNFDQDKAMYSGHSGKQRSKKEAALNTNHHNPGGHERKIVTKLMNAEKKCCQRNQEWKQVKPMPNQHQNFDLFQLQVERI